MREFLWKRGRVSLAQLGLFYLQLGEMRLRLGEGYKADADFHQVLEVRPDKFDYLTSYYHALAHEHFGQFREAIERFSEAINGAITNTSLNALPQFYFDRAQNCLRISDYSNAREDLERAIEMDAKDPRNSLELASLYLLGPPYLRSADGALSMALKACEPRDPNPDPTDDWGRLWKFLFLDGEPVRPHRMPLSTLGLAYYRLDRFEDAVQALEKSMKTESPGEAGLQTLLTLSMTHRRMGNMLKAQQYYAQAIERWPGEVKLSAQEQSELQVLRREAEEVSSNATKR